MCIERILQICVAAMGTMGTLLFGIGQQSVTLPLVSALAAVVSINVTDHFGWVRLNRSVANLAALLAVSLAVVDFFSIEQSSQLLALANLLVYLQVILLFQRKDERIYWQLLMLSLLQVMVASALNFDILFGVLMVVYLLLAVVTLSLFVLLREAAYVGRAAGGSSVGETGVRTRRNQGWFHVEGDELTLPSSTSLPAIGLASVCQVVLTLGLTGVLFYMVPRSAPKQAISGSTVGQRMVGFSETVELGELGTAFQSGQDVMRVRFHSSRGDSLTVQGMPMFRGTILNAYRSALDSGTSRALNVTPVEKSRWVFDDARVRGGRMLDMRHLDGEGRVQQETVLEPMKNEKTVFQIYPAIVSRNDPQIKVDSKRGQLKRRSSSNQKVIFNLETAGFDRHGDTITQRQINPAMRAVSEPMLTRLPGYETDLFPQLRAEAQRVLQEAEQAAATRSGERLGRVDRALTLERYFLTDPRFSYSLKGQQRDPALDPVEDFIANRPTGHCEYYATALALMLRSQGIPSRVVVGFKGGRWNSYGKFFQVEQLNAHSWVEAYLRPEHVPEERRRTWMAHGAWLRLDPTPGAGGGNREVATLTMFDRVRELGDYSQYLWGNYVVGLDSRRQRELVYKPLASLADFVQYFFSAEMWQVTVPEFFESLGKASTWRKFFDHLLSLRGIVITVLSLLLAYQVGRRLRRWSKRLRRRSGPQAAESGTERSFPMVAFYQQFEQLLARYGLSRPHSQTQQEFASSVGGELRADRTLRDVATLPKQVAEAFYRVRFGGHALDKQQTDAVEQSLDQLADALASAHENRPSKSDDPAVDNP